MERPRGILFDWDNTLVDSWAVIHEALVVTFATMGHTPWTLAETKQRVRHSLRDAFPRLFGPRWEEARRLYLDSFTAMHLQRLTALEGAEPLIEALARDGYYLAVVSNKTGALLRREAEYLDWSRYFRAMVGAGDASADKPHPAVVEAALSGSGIEPAEAWLVGDTALDLECAAAAGCVPVLVSGPEFAGEEAPKVLPALRFSDCAALLQGLRDL
jgi:phosphoglycolate phosphatase